MIFEGGRNEDHDLDTPHRVRDGIGVVLSWILGGVVVLLMAGVM